MGGVMVLGGAENIQGWGMVDLIISLIPQIDV